MGGGGVRRRTLAVSCFRLQACRVLRGLYQRGRAMLIGLIVMILLAYKPVGR